MPKVNQRASTPETPRLRRDTLRRAALYNSNPVGPFLKPKLTEPVDEDTLVRTSNRGIPFAAEKPSAQQRQERDRGFISSAPARAIGPGWNVGYQNKASVYPTEPHNLLRFGHVGAQKMQRGRINKNIVNTEWTPKLVMEPSKGAGDVKGTPGVWPDAAAHPTGAIVGLSRHKKNESWFAHETSAAPPTLPQPTAGMSVTLRSAETMLGSEASRAQGVTRGSALRSLDRLSRTLAREADSERVFCVQLNASRASLAASNASPSAAVLTEGLGPEATLKVLRRQLATHNKQQKAGGGSKKNAAQALGGGGRIVVPKSERRRPRFCGGLSVLVQDSRGGLDAGEAMRKAQSTEKQRAQQKWALLGRFHARWFQTARDKQRFSYDGLTTALSQASKDNADVSCVARDQFASVTLMRLRDMGLAHRLYSSLDDDRGSDALAWVDIVLPLTMLACAQQGQPQASVLLAGLRLCEAVAPPLTMSSVLAVLCCCCASRMEHLEVQTRAAAGFEFALRAGAAAAEMAATVSGGGGSWDGSLHEKQLLDAAGQVGKGGLNPDLVMQVLMEYPDLASDIQRQMNERFASAGRAIPSLAVVDNAAPSAPTGGVGGNKKRGGGATQGMAVGTLAAGSDGGMASWGEKSAGSGRMHGNGKTGRGWLEQGVDSGDRRKSSFIFPSAGESDDEGDVVIDG